jgi:HNH endonuclease
VVSEIEHQTEKRKKLILEPLMRCDPTPCISDQSWFDNIDFHHRFTSGGGMSAFPKDYEEKFYKLLFDGDYFVDNLSKQDSYDDIGNDHLRKGYSLRSYVLRDHKVRNAVKERANGKCEYCGKPGFKCEDGTPYLESHHIIALADDGKDRMSNVIAVCADDHRQAHFAANGEEIERKMHEIVTRLCRNEG